jgi:hypothetical protein
VRGAVESLVRDQGVSGLSRVTQGGGAYPVTRSGYTFDRMPLNVYVNAPKRRLPELLSRMQTIGENSELAGRSKGGKISLSLSRGLVPFCLFSQVEVGQGEEARKEANRASLPGSSPVTRCPLSYSSDPPLGSLDA